MSKPRGIYLPDEVWSAYEKLAQQTNSVPTRGTNAGQKPSLNALLRRIGEDEALVGIIASWLKGNRDERKEGRPGIVLRPQSPKTETVAWVHIQGRLVSVHFPEKRDDFGNIVKGLDYQWNAPYWQRSIADKDGTPLDRAAELCHRLLDGGFCVSPPNVAVQDKALAGDYDADGKRWITAMKAQSGREYFLIKWSRREDMYNAAIRITAAHYDGQNYGVRVPGELYDEVIDFAERYKFVMDDRAKELVQAAQAMRESALLVTNYAPVAAAAPADGSRPELVPESFEVDDDLADPHFAL